MKKPLLMLMLMTSVSSCTYSTSSVSNILSEVPRSSMTNVTLALQCVGEQVSKEFDNKSLKIIMLVVKDFKDGTIPEGIGANGPLSDSSAYDFKSVVRRFFPLNIVKLNNVDIELRSSTIDGSIKKEVVDTLLNNIGANYIYIIDGVFTQADVSISGDTGYGNRLTGKTNNSISAEGEITGGLSSSSLSLTFVMNVSDPLKNNIAISNSFSVKIYDNVQEAKITLGTDYISFSTSYKNRSVEGLHAAQRTLVEASALWFLYNFYGKSVDLNPCFSGSNSPAFVAIKAMEWNEATKIQRLQMIVDMIKQKSSGNINLEPNTDSIIRYINENYSKDKSWPISYNEEDLWRYYLELVGRKSI